MTAYFNDTRNANLHKRKVRPDKGFAYRMTRAFIQQLELVDQWESALYILAVTPRDVIGEKQREALMQDILLRNHPRSFLFTSEQSALSGGLAGRGNGKRSIIENVILKVPSSARARAFKNKAEGFMYASLNYFVEAVDCLISGGAYEDALNLLVLHQGPRVLAHIDENTIANENELTALFEKLEQLKHYKKLIGRLWDDLGGVLHKYLRLKLEPIEKFGDQKLRDYVLRIQNSLSHLRANYRSDPAMNILIQKISGDLPDFIAALENHADSSKVARTNNFEDIATHCEYDDEEGTIMLQFLEKFAASG
eukprot:TRINITY_DN2198_c0_g3_i2.p1 TRINITY_DN2198_c0_g3~~TRINITY_DN2198_c0_g3_i2.p1  ORF type:complete len:309 (+),score=61.57 TRINITY_DN2198_c0_g3_i2:420-1346(+)